MTHSKFKFEPPCCMIPRKQLQTLKVQLRLIDDQLHRVKARNSCQDCTLPAGAQQNTSLLIQKVVHSALAGSGKTINSRNLDQSRKRQQRGIVCNARSITRHLRLVYAPSLPFPDKDPITNIERSKEERTKRELRM